MVSISISTWGDPRAWANVAYKMDDGRTYLEQTRSSLPAILSYASPKPEKAFIIVLDTVVKHSVLSYEDLRGEVKNYYEDFLRSLNLSIPVEIIIAPGVGRFKLDVGGAPNFMAL
ncbi:hypothetical protein KEJ25_07920 [Candidatus Bathyarchaeota archaeon]|nr:hypothetical protein [Candidatus Bathyarchaeota archaeon]